MKRCKKCHTAKPLDEFYVANQYTNIYGEVSDIYRSICKQCMRKKSPAVKGTEQRCHICYKYHPVESFKLVWVQGITQRANICGSCEDKGHKIIKPGRESPINTFKESNFLVGFIGNESYKTICKAYRIKYEE